MIRSTIRGAFLLACLEMTALSARNVLAQPPAKGFNVLVWLMPFVALMAGLAALLVILRSWSAKRAARVTVSPPAPDELPAEYVARVERELQARIR